MDPTTLKSTPAPRTGTEGAAEHWEGSEMVVVKLDFKNKI